MIEVHVRSKLEGVGGRTMIRRLHITHIVIRINTSYWNEHEPSYANRIASVEGDILTLPHLQSITLETTKEEESTELAEGFPILRERDILCRRTCKESWERAQEAFKNPGPCAEKWGVVSPLWFSDKFGDDRCRQWCVVVSRPLMIP